jgi:molybdenum cofactor cytidylyltransferase
MITFIVLAAGESRRFPGNKLLFEIEDNVTIIELILSSILASKADRVIVILGHEAEAVHEKVQNINTRIQTVINPQYKGGGMSSSIRLGMENALESQAVLITPADIPFIRFEVIDLLIDYYLSNFPPLIIPTHQGRKGHPILISSKLFKYVLKVSEEKRGLKEVIKLFKDEIKFLPTKYQGILYDIDSVSDILELKAKMDAGYRNQ